LILALVRLALSWLYSHATAKLYTSSTPLGRLLGGHDVTTLPNEYLILDVRAGTRILVFGYFQLT
jgi:hypothetical protein